MQKRRAFTLVELLVTIAIIAILAGLVLAALGKAKGRGNSMTCLNDLNQLGKAFMMYQGDFADTFPAPGSRGVYGPQPEDWIWCDVTQSSISPFIAGFNPRVFTCPLDYEALRLQSLGVAPGNPYRYSYSLTSYDLTNGTNPGMSTIITPERKVYPFRASSIVSPAQKIMLVDEDRTTINDSRWVPVSDLIASRHDGKGYITFADGHNQLVTPWFGTNQENSNPLY
jgi:prepilin-type N-terminal cleavage/methylation domain-containing protein/prepilin-type processing-associated H-X9-DG protein